MTSFVSLNKLFHNSCGICSTHIDLTKAEIQQREAKSTEISGGTIAINRTLMLLNAKELNVKERIKSEAKKSISTIQRHFQNRSHNNDLWLTFCSYRIRKKWMDFPFPAKRKRSDSKNHRTYKSFSENAIP